MLEEESKEITTNNSLDRVIDNSTALLPLNEEQEKIVQNILVATDTNELQQQFDLFNLNQSKADAIRIIKLNKLLGKIEDQAIERFDKRPDQISNKEILEYMNVVSAQIDRASQHLNTIQEKPAIRATQNNTEVNINIGTELDRESEENVINAIQQLLKQVRNPVIQTPDNIVEADFTQNKSENIVYNSEQPVETTDVKVVNIDEEKGEDY